MVLVLSIVLVVGRTNSKAKENHALRLSAAVTPARGSRLRCGFTTWEGKPIPPRAALCILTQKGQNGPQDGKDDGCPNNSHLPLRTLIHLSLTLADGCPEDGQVGLARLVQEPQVDVISLLLQGLQQLQDGRLP